MGLKGLSLVFSSLLLLAGCQSLPGDIAGGDRAAVAGADDAVVGATVGATVSGAPFPPPDSLLPELEPVVERPPADLWERMRRQMRWADSREDAVESERRHFLRQHNYMGVVAGRGGLFLHYILEEVERRDMPVEIALLPMVESAFDPFALSPESASGLWQIMPATGRYLGLQRDWWYDGRRDLRESTRAALDYLEELHRHFEGDWMLALAAYNSGKSRVRRTQRRNASKGLSTNFWSLKLPRETRSYVPRLLALTSLVAKPEQYGITLPPLPNESPFVVAETGGQIEMRRAAELAAVPLIDLRYLNAGHRRWATAPERPQELLVPAAGAARFTRKLATLSPEDRVQWQYYRIQPGDSLIRIAKKFDTEVSLLREANSLKGSFIRAGDRLMIPSGGDWSNSLALADEGMRKPRGYRVRRGDSLYRIAGKFNVTVNEIVNWNSLDPGKYLQPGQKLTLYLHEG